MALLKIGSIVEGFGEVETVPILLRRFAAEVYHSRVTFAIPKPVRAKRHQLVKRSGGQVTYDDQQIRNAVELAAKNIGQDGAILLLLDADDDCACELGPELLSRNTTTHGHLHHSVVLPVTEFEAWYVATIDSLAGFNDVSVSARAPSHPERLTSPKARLQHEMGRTYSPTVDQPKFAAKFDLAMARERVASFAKLWRDLDRIVVPYLDP